MKRLEKIPFKPIQIGIDGGYWFIPSPIDGKPLGVIASNGAAVRQTTKGNPS